MWNVVDVFEKDFPLEGSVSECSCVAFSLGCLQGEEMSQEKSEEEQEVESPSKTWPPAFGEEEKAQLLLQRANKVKKRFGELKEKKKVAMTERELVDMKLRNARQYFDSADYFRQVQGLKDAPKVDSRAPTAVHVFKRDDKTGKLERVVKEPFSETLIKNLVVHKSYFDSADYALSLHGLLEYPLNTKPHPIMVNFTQQDVALIPHPEHDFVSEEDLLKIAEEADAQLRKKYHPGKPLTKQQVLKLKLRGTTPHGKEPLFDSADWSLKLWNVLPKEANEADKK